MPLKKLRTGGASASASTSTSTSTSASATSNNADSVSAGVSADSAGEVKQEPKAKRDRGNKTKGKAAMWDTLAWRSVDTTTSDLGDFEESVFMGLEEIDGNAYVIKKTGE
eukprot:CAMPEP_0173347986 /NCGR_PEP_ID=MMETSP1144-20121109/13470_1 /TAXON_ID=483371 /ORGANISM="non described non described, Strain CCMP2298" /LENGTH=109 /DNA_ID=CAMNT_0014295557 /DNA_START=44 /DNA_END=370 /DNA_ORIENTATION=-